MPSKTASSAASAGQPGPVGRGRGPLLVAVVVVLALVGAGVWFFLLRPDGDAAAEPEPEPEVGEVVALDPVSINLADGSYLRLGIALQQSAEADEEVEGSAALDAAVQVFSGRSVAELSQPPAREELKAALLDRVRAAYPEEVVDLYFTEFVTQ